MVRQRVDGQPFVVIDLEFGATEKASAFLRFLQTQVWANRERSPGLAGEPVARVLEPVHLGGPRHQGR